MAWGCYQLWYFLNPAMTPLGRTRPDSAGRERVNPTTSEFGMDLRGRPWTALARTGNAVSGVTRFEGSNPSCFAISYSTPLQLISVCDAIGEILEQTFDPHADPICTPK
jgi:hypothetical protein